MSGFTLDARCSSTADSAPNDETSASLSPKVLRGGLQHRPRVGVPQLGVEPRRQGHESVGGVEGHAHPPRSTNAAGRAVVGALVDMPEALGGPSPVFHGGAVCRLEAVEAAADHEARLLAKHVADGAHLAL